MMATVELATCNLSNLNLSTLRHLSLAQKGGVGRGKGREADDLRSVSQSRDLHLVPRSLSSLAFVVLAVSKNA
jgi:hypothetical protein